LVGIGIVEIHGPEPDRVRWSVTWQRGGFLVVVFVVVVFGGHNHRVKQSDYTVKGQFWIEAGTGSESNWSWLTDNQKRVTDRTWLQLMCCAHLYDMWVYGSYEWLVMPFGLTNTP